MNLKKFNIMCEAIREEQIELFKTAEKMFADGVYDIQSYVDLGINHPSVYYQQNSMFKKVNIESEGIGDYPKSFERDVENIKKFQEAYNEAVGVGKSEPYMEGSAYDGDIDSVWFTFHYYLLDETKLEGIIKHKIREAVAERLTPEGQSPRTPDCAMLQLYKDGAIDWETLRKITYKDCEL